MANMMVCRACGTKNTLPAQPEGIVRCELCHADLTSSEPKPSDLVRASVVRPNPMDPVAQFEAERKRRSRPPKKVSAPKPPRSKALTIVILSTVSVGVALVILAIVGVAALAAANQNPKNWKTYASNRGNFEIKMPGKPVKESGPAQRGALPSQTMHTIKTNIAVVVQEIPLEDGASITDPKDAALMLKRAMKIYLAESEIKVLSSETNRWVFGKPCLQVVVDSDQIIVNEYPQAGGGRRQVGIRCKADGLIFYEGSSLYLVWIAYPRPKPQEFSADEVFESFEFTNGKRLQFSFGEDLISQVDDSEFEDDDEDED